MLYNWLQGWSLYSLILKNIDLESNFKTQYFPKFSVTKESTTPDYKGDYAALYNMPNHEVYFSEKGLYLDNMWFTHVYFHELIHSTTRYNGRFTKLNNWFNANRTQENLEHALGLEERTADIGGLILALTFQSEKLSVETMVECCIKTNPTKLAFPWKDLEEAVYLYVRDKNCPKLNKVLKLVKGIIVKNNLMEIYEGNFNGQFETTYSNEFAS